MKKKSSKQLTRSASVQAGIAGKPSSPAAKPTAAKVKAAKKLKAPSSAKPPKPPKLPKLPKPAKSGKNAKAAKPIKEKRVHGSFSMPKSDYLLIGALKERCKREGHSAKKNELLRAGLRALSEMASDELRSLLSALDHGVGSDAT